MNIYTTSVGRTSNFRVFFAGKAPLWLLWASVLFLWIFSLQFFKLSEMNDLGLISIFPTSIIIAYFLILLGFTIALVYFSDSELLLLAYILLLVFMLHGTPQLLYNTLRYSWAWKHVGIVDYIVRHGAINPQIATLDVYHNWPGFFTWNALFTQLADLPSAQIYAGWAPAFFEVLFVIGLIALFRLLTPNKKLQYLSVWIFVLANWVGQDYFSPQATTFFMFIGLLVLVLLGFGSVGPVALIVWRDRFFSSKYISRFLLPVAKWVVDVNILGIEKNEIRIGKVHRFVLSGVVLLCFLMIASSHQLTPMMSAEFMMALVLFGYVNWKTLPVWMVAIIAFWVLGPAKSYNNEIIKSFTSAFGQVSANIDSGLIDVAKVNAGQVIVSWMGRGLTALVGLLAGIGVYKRIHQKQLDLVVILLAVIPVLTFFINSYGGELIFRVYFFSLPALSFMAASAFLPGKQSPPKLIQIVSISGVSLLLLVGFLFGYYGKDRQYYFTQGEVDAAEYVYSQAIPNSLLIEGSRNYPSQFMNYEYFTYVPLDREPVDSRVDFLNNPVSVFYRWMSNSDYSMSYLIITRSQKVASDTLGSLPTDALDKIEVELKKSNRFQVIYSNQDAVVFVLHPAK